MNKNENEDYINDIYNIKPRNSRIFKNPLTAFNSLKFPQKKIDVRDKFRSNTIIEAEAEESFCLFNDNENNEINFENKQINNEKEITGIRNKASSCDAINFKFPSS